MFDVIGLLIIIVIACAFFFLAKRASRIRNAFLRWLALGPSILLAAVAVVLAVTGTIGFVAVSYPGPHPLADPNLKVDVRPERVARGTRISYVCGECHSTKFGGPLVGHDFFEGDGPPVGTLYAPNLTPAGEIHDWSDAELVRAIREGIHKDGRALAIMPSKAFHNMSDEDAQSIVAYLRSQPASGTRSPATKLNVIGALFFGLGIAATSAQPSIAHPIVGPPPGPTKEYGKYLVSIGNCADCHGASLHGQTPRGPGPPPAPDIIAIVSTWNDDGFVRTFRTGVDPASHQVSKFMPWKSIGGFASDDDLRAMYAYLRTLGP